MTLFHPDYLDESRRAASDVAPLDAETGQDTELTLELTELEAEAELEAEDTAEAAGADVAPQTREAYLKKGEDLIRSLL